MRETLERRIARIRDAPETGVPLAIELRASGELLGDVSLTLGPPGAPAGRDRVHRPPRPSRTGATRPRRRRQSSRLPSTPMTCTASAGRLEARNTASARVLEKLGMRREAHLIENEWVEGGGSAKSSTRCSRTRDRPAALRSAASDPPSDHRSRHMIGRLDFVGVPSQDAERSRRFYGETLGCGPTTRPLRVLGRRHLLRHLGARAAGHAVRAAEERATRRCTSTTWRRRGRSSRRKGVEFGGETSTPACATWRSSPIPTATT